jgi:hypothetical protein
MLNSYSFMLILHGRKQGMAVSQDTHQGGRAKGPQIGRGAMCVSDQIATIHKKSHPKMAF